MDNINIQGCVLVFCLVSTTLNAQDAPPGQTAAPDELPTIFPSSEYSQLVAQQENITSDARREQLIERIELLEKKLIPVKKNQSGDWNP